MSSPVIACFQILDLLSSDPNQLASRDLCMSSMDCDGQASAPPDPGRPTSTAGFWQARYCRQHLDAIAFACSALVHDPLPHL